MKNDFECTDSDCMQYGKLLGNRQFKFIQAIWMAGEDEYCVIADTIDLSEMSLHDIECAICGYYDDIKEMEKAYGQPLGKLDWIIAECAFENNPYCNWEFKSEIVSRKRAEEIIQKFIDTNGTVFLKQ